MENKEFLTLKEAREQDYYCFKYREGVYRYKIEGEGRTLVEDGKVLVQGADLVHWYAKGVYDYKMEGKGWTVVEHGEVVIEGVDRAEWYARGVYSVQNFLG